MEAMQRSVKQSEVFQKQVSEAVEKAMKPWWLMGLPMPTATRPEPPTPQSVSPATSTEGQAHGDIDH